MTKDRTLYIRKESKIYCILFASIGVLFLLLGILVHSGSVKISDGITEKVNAKLAQKIEQEYNGRVRTYNVYAYDYKDGFFIEQSTEETDTGNIGDTVTIFIDPENPKRLTESKKGWQLELISIALYVMSATFLIGFPTYILIDTKLKIKKYKHYTIKKYSKTQE